jgi:hypothetical protein
MKALGNPISNSIQDSFCFFVIVSASSGLPQVGSGEFQNLHPPLAAALTVEE